MFRFMFLLGAALLICFSPAYADYEWTIFRNDRGVVAFAACEPALRPVVMVYRPAYVIGGEPLDAWFATQVHAQIQAWSHTYPSSVPQVRSRGRHLESNVSFKVDGQTWSGVFFAKARGGRAQWSVALARLADTILPGGPYQEARTMLEQYFATDEMLLPESPKPPAPRGTDGSMAQEGYLKSNSVKWILSGFLNDAERRYVLLDGGAAYEIAPPSNGHIAEGSWGRSQDSYRIDWNDGGLEIVPAACFRAETRASPEQQTESPSGPSTPGSNCHTELRTVMQMTTQFQCDYAGGPCGMRQVMAPSQVYQEICE